VIFGKRKPHAIKVSQLQSLLAPGVKIVGDVHFARGIRIDGRVDGNVVGEAGESPDRTLLVLSDKGHIEGSVRCGDAVINGTVAGDLHVEHFLELQPQARVSGTIRYGQLKMDVGAAVHGQLVKTEASPPAEAQPEPAP
jgi:cytoskeletal protein CcmA (bactofilin family)